MGRIGQAIARRLEAFGVPVAYHNRRPAEDVSYQISPDAEGLGAAVDTLISVAPGGAFDRQAVERGVFEALGPNGVFVNIGRGSTVDEDALIEALTNGTIARRRPRRLRRRAQRAAGAARRCPTRAAAACRLGLGAYAQRPWPTWRRQSRFVVQRRRR
jgi:hypothetical protein